MTEAQRVRLVLAERGTELTMEQVHTTLRKIQEYARIIEGSCWEWLRDADTPVKLMMVMDRLSLIFETPLNYRRAAKLRRIVLLIDQQVNPHHNTTGDSGDFI